MAGFAFPFSLAGLVGFPLDFFLSGSSSSSSNRLPTSCPCTSCLPNSPVDCPGRAGLSALLSFFSKGSASWGGSFTVFCREDSVSFTVEDTFADMLSCLGASGACSFAGAALPREMKSRRVIRLELSPFSTRSSSMQKRESSWMSAFRTRLLKKSTISPSLRAYSATGT